LLSAHSLPEYSVCEVESLVVNTFTQVFLEVLLHSLQHVGRNCCHFFPDVLFQIHRCPLFLFVHLALEISSEEEVLRLGTLVPMNIELPTKYPLSQDRIVVFNPLNPELNPICYLLALLGAHHFLHVSRIRVNNLTLRLLWSYIYGAPILDVSRSHTTTQHSR